MIYFVFRCQGIGIKVLGVSKILGLKVIFERRLSKPFFLV